MKNTTTTTANANAKTTAQTLGSYRETVLETHKFYKNEVKTVRGALKSYISILENEKNNILVQLAANILRGSGDNFKKFADTVRKNESGMTCVFWVEQALYKVAKQANNIKASKQANK